MQPSKLSGRKGMADDRIDEDEPLAGGERAEWQAPRVIRFGAAGASAGGGGNNADGDGKS
jgi:hypothetical protein